MNSAEGNVYEEILNDIKGQFGLSKLELERIVDSQFRLLRNTMSNREGKVVQMIYLGKFRPTMYNKDYIERLKLKNNEDR